MRVTESSHVLVLRICVRHRRDLLVAAAACWLAAWPAAAESARQAFAIPAQSLGESLAQFSRQTGLGVVIRMPADAARPIAALHGTYAPDEALAKLLEGAELVFRYAGPGAIVVQRAEPVVDAPTIRPAGNREPG